MYNVHWVLSQFNFKNQNDPILLFSLKTTISFKILIIKTEFKIFIVTVLS